MSEKYIKKYVKKFIPIEALQISNNPEELRAFLGESGTVSLIIDSQDMTVVIHTLEGSMTAHSGDYIIKGIKGEFYPCRKDIFEESYEEYHINNKDEFPCKRRKCADIASCTGCEEYFEWKKRH